MTRKKMVRILMTGAGIFCGLHAGGASAQLSTSAEQATASPPSLDEIVVTARRRSESLLSVPVAVTALSANDIARYNSSSISELTQLTPQLVITTAGSGSGANISIRGIGSVSEDPGLDQSVGLYFDNVGISRGRIIGLSMFDVAQVEVLKGPQALFFGKNSPAGVVAISTAGPGRDLEAKLVGGYEFKARQRYLEAAVGGPLSETLGARLALRGEKSDGYARAIARPVFDPLAGVIAPGALDRREPAEKKIAGRLTLKYDPSSEFSVTGKLFYGRTRTNNPAGGIERACASGVTPAVSGVPDPATPECALERFHDERNRRGILQSRAAGLSLQRIESRLCA